MDRKMVNEKALEINNAGLEEALRAFAAEKSKENLAQMMHLMRTARFLIPAEFPKNIEKNIAVKLAKGIPLKPGEGPRMRPMVVQNASGERFMPVFTSKKQLPKKLNSPAVLNVKTDEILRLAADPAAKLSGILVNPESDKMILHPQFIDALKKMMQEQPQKKEIKMTREQFEIFARKSTEWGLIPKAVFEEKGGFMEKLEEQREAYIAQFYRQPYGDKIQCPYGDSDFDVMVLNIDEETCVASVGLPEKNTSPQAALSMYIVWNPPTDDMHYFMIEKGQPQQQNVLCSISPQGRHEELQTAPSAGNELAAVLDLVREENQQ